MRDVIDVQFKQLIPLLKEHDILIATNSEFAAASVADYCQKPFIRTAFAPFIPGRHIPPPIFPYPKPHPIFTPRFIWKLLNIGNNYMTQKTINKNREQLGLKPLNNCGYYSTERAFNYMLYSRYLGIQIPIGSINGILEDTVSMTHYTMIRMPISNFWISFSKNKDLLSSLH